MIPIPRQRPPIRSRRCQGATAGGTPYSKIWRGAGSVLAAVLAVALTANAGAPAIAAEDVGHQIKASWAKDTPEFSGSGDPVTAEVWANINDIAPAPGNDKIPNVTMTFTVNEHAKFTALPELCTADGDPKSSISKDGRTMICNLGTVADGSALKVLVPMLTDGKNGDELTFDAMISSDANHNEATAPQLKHPIKSPFMMDVNWTDPAGDFRTTDYKRHEGDFQWTLFWGKGTESDPGPDTVEYDLKLKSNVGRIESLSCTPFSDTSISNGHPYSFTGDVPSGVDAGQVAPFPECKISGFSATDDGQATAKMTLSGLSYDDAAQKATNASNGSGLGNRYAIGAGQLVVTQNGKETDGSITLESSRPTYTSQTGATSTDLEENNRAEKTWVAPGGWNSWWQRGYSGAAGNIHDTSFFVAPGAKLESHTALSGPNSTLETNKYFEGTKIGLCQIVDRESIIFTGATAQTYPIVGTTANPKPGPLPGAFKYFVVKDPSKYLKLNGQYAPYDSDATYAKRTITCGDLQAQDGDWVDQVPADKSAVQAVRFDYTRDDALNKTAELLVHSDVKGSVKPGQDVWELSSWWLAAWNDGKGQWVSDDYNREDAKTTGMRFPSTNLQRDLVRISAATPWVNKVAQEPIMRLGKPGNFTVSFGAKTWDGASGPGTVDDYRIEDVLPLGMSYVAGTTKFSIDGMANGGKLEPKTSKNDEGRTVLTWTLQGLPTDWEHSFTYQAKIDESTEEGQRYWNDATVTLAGNSDHDNAVVTVASAGVTSILKATDQENSIMRDAAGEECTTGACTGSWTVTLLSDDPITQKYTDVIDILPYKGDGRATTVNGTKVPGTTTDKYTVSGVIAEGQTVYYTNVDPKDLTDDPADEANGAPNKPSDIWVEEPMADATAIRVIGGELRTGEDRKFQIIVAGTDLKASDVLVNRAQGRSEHTQLVMRTSAAMVTKALPTPPTPPTPPTTPPTPPTTPPTPPLVTTGGQSMMWAGGAALLLLIAGGSVVLLSRRKRSGETE